MGKQGVVEVGPDLEGDLLAFAALQVGSSCRVCRELPPDVIAVLNRTNLKVSRPIMAAWIAKQTGKIITRHMLEGHFGRPCGKSGGEDAGKAGSGSQGVPRRGEAAR